MKVKTSWNLKLLYKSDSDPQIEKDLRAIEEACSSFEKKYKNQPFTASPESLEKALAEYEKVELLVSGSKPWWYFRLKKDLNLSDEKSSAAATKNDQRTIEASNKLTFFTLDIAKIPESDRKNFLNHPLLKGYSYMLSRIFDQSKFNLSEGEEQLQELLSQTSYTMWIESQQRLLGEQVIKHKGKQIPIVKAVSQFSNMPKKDRREMQEKINSVFKSISHMSEAELNAVYNYKKIIDERRGYKKPYSATVLQFENDEKAVESFVALISKNFKISHKFHKVHARLLGEKKIPYADRTTKIGVVKAKFDIETSISIVRKVLEKFGKEYLDIFNSFLENGQIDFLPKKGKQGGAYCWSRGNLPTYVLLNHVSNLGSLETLAHEMGHAIHTEMSKSQPPRYRKYSTSTAEVASMFFEQMIGDEVEKHLSDKEKIILLHYKIQGDILAIFRQIACFNFENELHEKIRKEGEVSKEKIAELMSKHLKSYMGSSVNVSTDDGYSYVYWMHIRRFFYVYTYAYGQIISRALYEKWKENPSYAEKVKQFLSAGRSMSPESIFKMIGIDITDNSFFEAALKGIEKDIEKLDKLTKGKKKF